MVIPFGFGLLLERLRLGAVCEGLGLQVVKASGEKPQLEGAVGWSSPRLGRARTLLRRLQGR